MDNKKITRESEWEKPVYLRKLVDKIGTQKASDALGCSDTKITTALSANQTTKVTELAARGVWREQHEEKPGQLSDNLLIIQAPTDKIETIITVVRALGVKLWNIERA